MAKLSECKLLKYLIKKPKKKNDYLKEHFHSKVQVNVQYLSISYFRREELYFLYGLIALTSEESNYFR